MADAAKTNLTDLHLVGVKTGITYKIVPNNKKDIVTSKEVRESGKKDLYPEIIEREAILKQKHWPEDWDFAVPEVEEEKVGNVIVQTGKQVVETPKKKRKRRTKKEMEAENDKEIADDLQIPVERVEQGIEELKDQE